MKLKRKAFLKSVKATWKTAASGVTKGAVALKEKVSDSAKGLNKEAKIGPELHESAMAALQRMFERDPSLKESVAKAHAFAVFPSVARGSLVLGVTFGKGEVFKRGRVIGYAGVVQVTAGVQVGGKTLHMLVIMDDPEALECFKSGKISFAANASVAMMKAGALAGRSPAGFKVHLFSEGGEMLDASIGGQTFKFRPAFLGRLRTAA